MARVFVEMGDLETAVAVREAAAADGHDVEMIETPGDIESRLRPVAEEMALVLTGRLDETVASGLSGVFSGAIPRPPLLAVVPEDDPEELRRVARLFDLDEAIPAPPDPAEVQVALLRLLQERTGDRATLLRDLALLVVQKRDDGHRVGERCQ